MVGLAICMVIVRLAVRFRMRRKLFLDDYFVLLAVVMMIGAASIFHTYIDGIYLYRALTKPNPDIVLNFREIRKLMPGHIYSLAFAFVETSWTAIFCIKFSFLSLFHTLIRKLSVGLTQYFWAVVVITVLTWVFMLTDSPILCSVFGANSCKFISPLSSSCYLSNMNSKMFY
jgi:hypothetical protein